MLEFNNKHKTADLSTIKTKTNKAKNAGKVMLCGALLSGILLLSGCGKKESDEKEQSTPFTTATAIMMENENAVIIDLQSYQKYWYEHYTTGSSVSTERLMELTTSDGDKIIVDSTDTKIYDGENSHQKAEIIASSLVGETGEVIDYDEIATNEKLK